LYLHLLKGLKNSQEPAVTVPPWQWDQLDICSWL